MKPLSVNIPETAAAHYPILIGTGLLGNSAKLLRKHLTSDTVVIITDRTVSAYYGQSLEKTLKKTGYQPLLLAIPPGERSKNTKMKERLETHLFRHYCDRNTTIIALGGGVVGDLAGFIAATYLRGITYIQIPTTLLAMVDSSVGGKTGVNTSFGKNLIGAYWQPQAVIADLDCLETLPRRHIINGLVEALKIFLTHDASDFQSFASHLKRLLAVDKGSLKRFITRAVNIKAEVVACDEQEKTGERMLLNFGHTIGHALEQLSQYRILHGFAVGLGILVEAKIAEQLGLLAKVDYLQIKTLLAQLSLHAYHLRKFDPNQVIQATYHDKKNAAGKVRYVLLNNIGSVYRQQQVIHEIPDKIVKQAILELTRHHPS